MSGTGHTVGIDPGNRESAYTVFDGIGQRIISFAKVDNNTLKGLLPRITANATHVFIEGIQSYGMPVGKDVFETAYFIGRLMETLERMECPASMVFRKDVKMYWCNSLRAKDSNMIAAIVDRFDPGRRFGKYGKGVKADPGPLYGMSKDCWSSTAIAIYGSNIGIKTLSDVDHLKLKP